MALDTRQACSVLLAAKSAAAMLLSQRAKTRLRTSLPKNLADGHRKWNAGLSVMSVHMSGCVTHLVTAPAAQHIVQVRGRTRCQSQTRTASPHTASTHRGAGHGAALTCRSAPRARPGCWRGSGRLTARRRKTLPAAGPLSGSSPHGPACSAGVSQKVCQKFSC